jgi:hypothetical protein
MRGGEIELLRNVVERKRRRKVVCERNVGNVDEYDVLGEGATVRG